MLKGIELFEPITELPLNRINQKNGTYTEEYPCCVGAHLAHELSVTSDTPEDYLKGADTWAEQMGITRAHLILMLRRSGAGEHPFASDDWESSPTKVFANLCKIEEFPTLVGANLTFILLHEADLRHTDFTKANLYCANFRDANLASANLTEAYLCRANFRYADLTNANLTGANLTRAKLQGANLTGTNLTGVDLTDINLHGVDLTKAILPK